jgi:hypothetical protein
VEISKLKEKYEKLINKFDTTCGGMLGNGFIYEKVIVTEYKKEMKAFETETGSIKEGQCFVLKVDFNYGYKKGLVYRIHKSEYNESYYAYKLNGKLTKECTGKASSNNRFYIGTLDNHKFRKWVQEGSISWCEIKEVNTPYEVEKTVKRMVKTEQPTEELKTCCV